MARQKVGKFISKGYSNETSQNRKTRSLICIKSWGTIERNDGMLEATELSSQKEK